MTKPRYSGKPSKEKEIAKVRIESLFKNADDTFHENKERSNKYISLARKIAMKFKFRIPPVLKRQFCKHCYCYLKQGINCRVRLTDGHITYYCLNCKKFMRFPYLREQREKRKAKLNSN